MVCLERQQKETTLSMEEKHLGVLAFDTSNYTTSIAVVDSRGCALLDLRKSLVVKEGERGLRQSDALFQHIQNLPLLLEEGSDTIGSIIFSAVAVSDKPRPVEKSYMPVFTGGLSCGRSLAAVMGIPLLRFSHQEGHIAAASYRSGMEGEDTFLAFHLSGGTTELLYIERSSITKIGGSKDISMGQLIDRAGVAAGMGFPAGALMDRLSLGVGPTENSGLSPVHFEDLYINLSGLETQILRIIKVNPSDIDWLSAGLFTLLSDALIAWAEKAMRKTGCKKVLFTGGVASSTFIRNAINNHFKGREANVFFGQPALSTDNAVGIGILGAKKLWQ